MTRLTVDEWENESLVGGSRGQFYCKSRGQSTDLTVESGVTSEARRVEAQELRLLSPWCRAGAWRQRRRWLAAARRPPRAASRTASARPRAWRARPASRGSWTPCLHANKCIVHTRASGPRRACGRTRTLHDARADLRADAALRPAVVARDEPVRLLNALDDRALVHRTQRSQVDHLRAGAAREWANRERPTRKARESWGWKRERGEGRRKGKGRKTHLAVDAELLERLGRVHGDAHADRIAHDRELRAWPLDLRASDVNREFLRECLVGHRKRLVVHDLILEADHRVRIADRRLEQAARVLRGPRRHHLQAWHRRVPRRETLRVLRRYARRRSVRAAEHDRDVKLINRARGNECQRLSNANQQFTRDLRFRMTCIASLRPNWLPDQLLALRNWRS